MITVAGTVADAEPVFAQLAPALTARRHCVQVLASRDGRAGREKGRAVLAQRHPPPFAAVLDIVDAGNPGLAVAYAATETRRARGNEALIRRQGVTAASGVAGPSKHFPGEGISPPGRPQRQPYPSETGTRPALGSQPYRSSS